MTLLEMSCNLLTRVAVVVSKPLRHCLGSSFRFDGKTITEAELTAKFWRICNPSSSTLQVRAKQISHRDERSAFRVNNLSRMLLSRSDSCETLLLSNKYLSVARAGKCNLQSSKKKRMAASRCGKIKFEEWLCVQWSKDIKDKSEGTRSATDG